MPTNSDPLSITGIAPVRPWHALPQKTVFDELDAGPAGLQATEAARRLERYDPNRLPKMPFLRGRLRLLAQSHIRFIDVLLGAVLIVGTMARRMIHGASLE